MVLDVLLGVFCFVLEAGLGVVLHVLDLDPELVEEFSALFEGVWLVGVNGACDDTTEDDDAEDVVFVAEAGLVDCFLA